MLRHMSSTDARRIARRYYATHGRHLEEDMAALCANPQGAVVFSPRLVAMVKPVRVSVPGEWMDLAHSPTGADAWYLHLLCGDLRYAACLAADLPQLRWAVFQRGARNAACHRLSWGRVLLYLNRNTHI